MNIKMIIKIYLDLIIWSKQKKKKIKTSFNINIYAIPRANNFLKIELNYTNIK